MRKVAVIGIGQTNIDEHWDKSQRELTGDAILTAMQDAGITHIDGLFVGNMLSASANKQQHLGAYLGDWIGERGKSAIRLNLRVALVRQHSGRLSLRLLQERSISPWL